MDQQSFLFQAMIYLAASVAMVPIAKKIGLGSVLGYLLAGIIIGPSVFGFVGEEGQDIMHFAEFGVVMMLFLIGLELEPELLWKMRKSIAGLGGLQVLITSSIIGLLAIIFGLPWQQGLAVGMALSLSSTAIVMQSLNEKGLIKTSAGQSAFSVLLFQDIVVIPMLAIFPLLATLTPDSGGKEAHGSTLVEGLPGWGKTLAVIGAVISIIVAGRYLIKPLLRIIAQTRLRELFTASALLLVVGIAVLMTQVGLSPALGTFLAGVILANSEYRHELESDIEPFKGLLLGLFFLAVGASIDFDLIFSKPLLIFGMVIGLMLIKALILLILGKLFGLVRDQNVLFGLSLNQMGEFGFVLFAFALSDGILPKNVVDILIAVVALSMALTPLVLMVNEKFIQPRFGTKEEEGEEMEPDAMNESNPVIIAGFGHFGNTIGRFLRAHHIGTTILEIDSDRVDLLRKLGFKVFYGDATRYDLLQSAGALQAKILIIAIDDNDKRLALVETVKKHFPHLRMLVRATNRVDTYDLMNAGMLHVYRETLDTSLRVGVDALKFLGYRAYNAQRAARTFLKNDEYNLKTLASIRDRNLYIHTAKELIEELENTIREDMKGYGVAQDKGWDEESLIAEAKQNAELANK